MPKVFSENLVERSSTAPPDVLYHTVAYANAHGINAIWIDQECIYQHDALEKEAAIQEMDFVYEDSKHPIAVLEFVFQIQEELDVFSSVCDEDFFTFDPSQIAVLEDVLFRLVDDAWFERAWTLQESASAGVRMTLLLGCPGLQKSSHFGPSPGDFEISIWDFQNTMVNVRNLIEDGLAAGMWSDGDATNASNYADVLWNSLPTIVPDNGNDIKKRDLSHRQVCNAAQALSFLDDRFNSVFSDRLAILANLCDFQYRVNSKVLESAESSFSICALTLAVLNGDMSLLGGYRAQSQAPQNNYSDSRWDFSLAVNGRSNGLVFQNDNLDSSSNAYGFSWGPNPSACLKSIVYLEEDHKLFRLEPATLSTYGLRVRGVLWTIEFMVELPKTQENFVLRWQEELALQIGEDALEGMTRQKPSIQDIFWSLLHELIQLDFHELARSVWNHVQPLGKSSILKDEDAIAPPPPYSYDTVFGPLMQNATGAGPHPKYDEKEIRGGLSAPHLSFDLESEAVDRPNIERLMIEQVCENGVLLCGSPVGISQNTKQPLVWFETCKLGDQIFTPVTKLGDGAVRSRYRKEAISWRVIDTANSIEECRILHCLGRRRGIWRVEGLTHQDYILD